jgi:AcrR family transcriptional regulator
LTTSTFCQDAWVTSTRERLIEAAAELIDEGGAAAVTLREVGRRAGVSHNAPYKHFADKEELLAAVVAAGLRDGAQAIERLLRARSGADAVRRVLLAYVRDAAAHPELFRLTYGSWRNGSAELSAAADAARGALVDAVVAAQRAHELPAGDPERLTALLLALAHGAADLELSGHLARDGKGHANSSDLVNELFVRLGSR